jgi:drug/metabolite transporter (DMT)-like permease
MTKSLWLYLSVVLIWGSTWFAIRFQLSLPPLNSVLYRFALATALCFAWSFLRREELSYPWRQHLVFAAQGVCLFSLNYILFYHAERFIASGLVAATFTLVIYTNMIGLRVFYGQLFSRSLIVGSLLGGVGICLLFWDSIVQFKTDQSGVIGLALGGIATLSASGGNLISVGLARKKIPVIASTSWGLLYGSTFTLILLVASRGSLVFDTSASYLASLVYLALFGTVFAFAAYLKLIGDIGADRAAYANILTPVIALILSAWFEDFHWHWWTVVGMLFCGAGNYWTLHRKARRPQM